MQHYIYPGAWHTNKVALGWDILRAPFNLFWAPVYVTISLFAILAQKTGSARLYNLLNRMPAGLTTKVQQHVVNLVSTNLLQRTNNENCTSRLEQLIQKEINSTLHLNDQTPQLSSTVDHAIHDALTQYAITRTASSDITNTFVSTIVGAAAFNKFTPGGLGIGVLIAFIIAKENAKNNFIFGQHIGGLYYSIFPPEPSGYLITGSIAVVLALLAVMASISGLITDPIQAVLGLHNRRLNLFIDKLEHDFFKAPSVVSALKTSMLREYWKLLMR